MTNEEYDLVVVGAGNAALCSAIASRENGLTVLVLERGPKNKRGGNSFFTDGAIRFAYKDVYALQSIIPTLTDKEVEKIEMPDYHEEDYYEDIMRVTEGKSAPELANQLVSKSFETIEWMKKQGVEFGLNQNQVFEKDGKKQFWGGLPVWTHRKGIGLIETLVQRAESLGIDISYDTRAVKLQKNANRISGITVKQEGAEKTIATKAVILACGGFEANKEKRMKHLGDRKSVV